MTDKPDGYEKQNFNQFWKSERDYHFYLHFLS